MLCLEAGRVGESQSAGCDARRSALETARVDESVGQEHDLSAHAVLVLETDHSLWVRFTQQFEEGNGQAAFTPLRRQRHL